MKTDFTQVVSKIKGYQNEAKSHSSVALAVLQGKADLGLGIRTVADRYGLDFIPILDEKYDFVVQRSRFYMQPIQAFIEVLNSEALKEEFKKRAPGLVLTKDTGKIIYPL